MKLLILFAVMLSAFVSGTIASKHHWQKSHTSASKMKDGSKGCSCLNGGTCVSYSLFSRINRCICPEGYIGDFCEINYASKCYAGNGKDYRGTKSVNEDHEKCLAWDTYSLQRQPYNEGIDNAMELGLGKHNYCRNPNGRSRPWCYVRKGFRTISTPCDIPLCHKSSTCGQRNFSKYYKIVGGQRADVESQPWIASIFQTNRRLSTFKCGGSLIDPCWVLTAAHCFENKTPDPSKYTVFLGKNAVNATDTREQAFSVSQIIIHEAFSYQQTDYNNDIALMRIRSHLGQCAEESSTVKTICLPSQNLLLADHFQCEVSGYGKEKSTDIFYSRILKSTNVNLIPQSLCRDVYYNSRTLNDNMFCAGDPQWRTDSCSGDSGGPLVCHTNGRMVLYGIVSWGDGCAKERKPGVYTRVTKYLPWIESHMNGIQHFKSYYPPK